MILQSTIPLICLARTRRYISLIMSFSQLTWKQQLEQTKWIFQFIAAGSLR